MRDGRAPLTDSPYLAASSADVRPSSGDTGALTATVPSCVVSLTGGKLSSSRCAALIGHGLSRGAEVRPRDVPGYELVRSPGAGPVGSAATPYATSWAGAGRRVWSTLPGIRRTTP